MAVVRAGAPPHRPRGARPGGVGVTKRLCCLGSLGTIAVLASLTTTAAVHKVTAVRFSQNPLITVDSSRSLGGNVNGPTVIRVPDWIDRPLGRYYMYFANHMGTFIRLAYADALTGPWKIYEPGVLQARDTAFFRPQPDPPDTWRTSTRTWRRRRFSSIANGAVW
jgi:hypothetical protein